MEATVDYATPSEAVVTFTDGEHAVQATYGSGGQYATSSAAAPTPVAAPHYVVASYEELEAALEDPDGLADEDLRIRVAADIGPDGFEEHGQLSYSGEVPLRLSSDGAVRRTLDAGGHSRVLRVREAPVEITNLRFTGAESSSRGGAVRADHGGTVTSSVFVDNVSEGLGGAAIFSRGDLTVDDTLMADNHNVHSGASEAGGGALHVRYGDLAVRGSTLQGNTGNRGGAVRIRYGDATFGDSVVRDNDAGWRGGAIHAGQSLNLTDVTAERNEADSSSADFASVSEDLVIASSTFTGHAAPNGGVATVSGTTEITDSEFVANRHVHSCSHCGGGVIRARDDVTVHSSVFLDNTAQRGSALQARDGGSITTSDTEYSGNSSSVLTADGDIVDDGGNHGDDWPLN